MPSYEPSSEPSYSPSDEPSSAPSKEPSGNFVAGLGDQTEEDNDQQDKSPQTKSTWHKTFGVSDGTARRILFASFLALSVPAVVTDNHLRNCRMRV
jgi:hypothetical protein